MCDHCNNPNLHPINSTYKTIELNCDGTKKMEVTYKVYAHGEESSPLSDAPGRWKEYSRVLDRRPV
jgi:hypothetical protein